MAKQQIKSNQMTPLDPQVWIAPSLENSWTNYGADHETAGYMKDSMGFVHLKGLVKNGTSGVIFTLPVGYRPANNERPIYAVMSGATIGRCDVNGTTGAVTATSPYSASWFSLSGITFRAEE